jgi:hypothetical protein
MKMLNYLIVLSFFACIISSCTTTHEGKPISTGRNAEILVLTTNNIWNTDVGDTIKSVFMQPQIGLNQPEPMFRLFQVDKLDDLLKKYRNILHVIIHDSVLKPAVQYSPNPFASPQTYVEIRASSKQDFFETLHKTKETLFEKFRETDYKRIQRAFAMQDNKVLQNQIKNKFGISIILPQSFWMAKEYIDFAWLRLETNRYSQALLMYEQEFVDSSSLHLDYLIELRNTVTRIHIPGSIDGSYMTTDTIIQPIIKFVPYNNTKIIEIRGLWRTIGDFMGGPFVSYVFINPEKNKMIVLEGYVYYPNNEKRDLLLQLEAIIHSLKFHS